MSIYFFCFDEVDPLGGSTTHPIEPLAPRLGRKLLLAGSSGASSSPLQDRSDAARLARVTPSKPAQAGLKPRLLSSQKLTPEARAGAFAEETW